MEAQTCALPPICDRNLEINPMTLKLEGDLDILRMYLHTGNENEYSSQGQMLSQMSSTSNHF